MGFLAPLFLFLGAAAAVPLLLHLMRRRSGTRRDFPAARYLQRAEEEHSRKLRLRNLLLMLLRVAAVLLIAVAAARPVGRLAGSGHPPTAVAIVLDNSLSTSQVVNGRPVLEDLREGARAVLARASASDRLWLVTADGRVEAGGADALRAAVDAVRPLGGAGRPREAVARAAGLVAGAAVSARQVALLTDAQASAWSALGADHVPLVAYVPPGQPAPNRAVTLAEARPSRWTPRGAVVARVAAPDTVTYRIALAGRTLARGEAAPGEEVVVQASPSGDGWSAGRLALDPDELRGDDVRHFAVWLGPPVAVRADASAGAFAASAVATLVQSGRAAAGGAVVIAGADAAPRLPALLVAPADPLRLGAANRALERLGVPWRFGPARRGRVTLRGERVDGASATLRYALQAAPGADADTLVSAGAEPWAVAGDGYVLLASPLEPSATDLPLRAAFVPFLGDLLSQRLSANPGVVRDAAPGARVRVPRWVTGVEGAGTLRPDAAGMLTAPSNAGVYFLIRGTARAGALVVNPEPEESVLQRLSPSELRARVGGRGADVLSATPRFAAAVYERAAGRSLVVPLLAGALLLLGAESLATRRQGRH